SPTISSARANEQSCLSYELGSMLPSNQKSVDESSEWTCDPEPPRALARRVLPHVVERFDVLVQLLVHRWGLVGIGDHFDVGGAVGLLGCVEGVVELPAGDGRVPPRPAA